MGNHLWLIAHLCQGDGFSHLVQIILQSWNVPPNVAKKYNLCSITAGGWPEPADWHLITHLHPARRSYYSMVILHDEGLSSSGWEFHLSSGAINVWGNADWRTDQRGIKPNPRLGERGQDGEKDPHRKVWVVASQSGVWTFWHIHSFNLPHDFFS